MIWGKTRQELLMSWSVMESSRLQGQPHLPG